MARDGSGKPPSGAGRTKPRLPRNLYWRGDVIWARIKVSGVDHRRPLRTANVGEAQKRLEAFREEISHLAYWGESRRSWKDAVVHYVEDIMPDAVRASTATRYLTSLRMVDSELGELYLDEITNKRIGALVRARKRQGATNATVRRDLTAISRVLSAASAQGWVEANVAKAWERDTIPERRDPIGRVTDEDVARFLAKAPPVFGRVVLLLLQTGMRQGEALSLRRSQVDHQNSEIHLPRTKSRPRVIQVSDAAMGTIKGTPASLATDHVFVAATGGPYRNFPSRFRQIAITAGTRFRCHDLRHEFAIRELENGRDIYDLSRHLGHSSVKVTEIYLDYVNEAGAQMRAQRRRFGAKGDAGEEA